MSSHYSICHICVLFLLQPSEDFFFGRKKRHPRLAFKPNQQLLRSIEPRYTHFNNVPWNTSIFSKIVTTQTHFSSRIILSASGLDETRFDWNSETDTRQRLLQNDFPRPRREIWTEKCEKWRMRREFLDEFLKILLWKHETRDKNFYKPFFEPETRQRLL